MAGRPRKAVGVSRGKIGKEKRLSRKIQEEKIRVDRLQLEEGAPEWLSPSAAEEYMRIVHEAGKINLLDNIDRAFLAIYADNYDRYTRASAALQMDGLTVTTENGEFPSPYIKIASDAATQIHRCSTKLGLAATDRLKLIVPVATDDKPKNKFLKYL
ncbi:phage terminase small subunit P27 family [uncultured Selenomonas sp.]|uniref:phage terminase small subunit P27 family n=1 Tax=uncultured Selenomonas sp. TaxID=159275 RepID=UPI0028D47C83|nr:phage terminase small subunit P27 family [uncultured Selenomonas sp.]